jgi:hypothetical protein
MILVLLVSCTKSIEIAKEQANYFVKYFGGSATDKAMDMKLCPDSSYVLTGSLTQGSNVSQAFFIHVDRYGNLLGSSPSLLGNGSLSGGNSICRTSDGNFLIAGFITFAGHSDKDVYVVKVSSDGSVIWTKSFGGSNNDEAFSVRETSSGNILVGGYTESYGNGGKDAWGLLLDSTGNKIWDKTYGFVNDDVCNYLVEKDKYFLLVGYSDNYQYVTYRQSVFLVKIDKTSGIAFDIAYYGGTNDESGVKSVVDATGNIYVLANSVSSGISNIYVMKLTDNIHQSLWEKYLTSTLDEKGNDIILQNNQVIIVGSSTANQNTDFLIDILDTNGNLLNGGANTLPAEGDQVAQACTIGSDGKVVFAGSNNVQGFSKICLVKTDLPR